MELDFVEKSAEGYFISKNWLKYEDTERVIYSKKKINWDFVDFKEGSPRLRKSVHDVNDEFRKFFYDYGYVAVDALPIVNKGSTIFVTAGVQIFLDQNLESLPEKMYILQPVMRTQYLNSDEKEKGILSSFVNICTEKKNATHRDFVEGLDMWVSYLSKIGIYAGDLMIEGSRKTDDWGKGRFNQYRLKVIYRNLEIGDCVFIEGAVFGERKTNVCDLGFGLERVLWALNKTNYFVDSICPGISLTDVNVNEFDLVRGAVLLAASGVKSGNYNEEYRLKKIIKELAPSKYLFLEPLIENSYTYWSEFTNLKLDIYKTKQIIVEEMNLISNSEIDKKLGLNNPEKILKKNRLLYFDAISGLVSTKKLENL